MPAKTVKVGISRTELVQEVHHWDPQSLQESLQGKDVTEAIREKVRDFMTRHGLTNIDDIRDKNGVSAPCEYLFCTETGENTCIYTEYRHLALLYRKV